MNREGFKRSIGARLVAVLFAVGMLISSAGPGTATEPVVQQGLVDKARITFQRFMVDKQMTWFHEHLKEAEGLLIIPELLKAGFIFGGSGGTGVLVVRDRKTGDWSEPAFYTIGSVSFGAQIGGESAEVIMMAMTRKAIDSLFASSFKLGGDTSITAGPVGVGAKANITADFISFARSKGIYAGMSLEGAVVDVRDSYNRAYYGKDARPVDIIVKREVKNPGSSGLREALKKAVK